MKFKDILANYNGKDKDNGSSKDARINYRVYRKQVEQVFKALKEQKVSIGLSPELCQQKEKIIQSNIESIQKICLNSQQEMTKFVDFFDNDAPSKNSETIQEIYQTAFKQAMQIISLPSDTAPQVEEAIKREVAELVMEELVQLFHRCTYEIVDSEGRNFLQKVIALAVPTLFFGVDENVKQLIDSLIGADWPDKAPDYGKEHKKPTELAQEKNLRLVSNLFQEKSTRVHPGGWKALIVALQRGALREDQVAATPMSKIGIPAAMGSNVSRLTGKEVVLKSAMVSTGIAKTPGGTGLKLGPTVRVDTPTQQGKIFKIWLPINEDDDQQTPAKGSIIATSSSPSGLVNNTKIDFPIVEITPERIKYWEAVKAREHGRYIQQDQVMGLSAQEVAKNLGMDEKIRWNWCHLIAYSMGGADGIYPKTKAQQKYVGPQRETNLVLGTAVANARMLIVEEKIKELVKETGKSLYVQVTPTFITEGGGTHLAEKLDYTIQDSAQDPKSKITFTFKMCSPRKIFQTELDIISTILQKTFGGKKPEKILEEEIEEKDDAGLSNKSTISAVENLKIQDPSHKNTEEDSDNRKKAIKNTNEEQDEEKSGNDPTQCKPE